jgi:hypothetical protein
MTKGSIELQTPPSAASPEQEMQQIEDMKTAQQISYASGVPIAGVLPLVRRMTDLERRIRVLEEMQRGWGAAKYRVPSRLISLKGENFMDHFDSRQPRHLPGRTILPEPGQAERQAQFQRVEKIRAEILSKSKYSDDGVNIKMIVSGMRLLVDYETALNAVLLGNAELL